MQSRLAGTQQRIHVGATRLGLLVLFALAACDEREERAVVVTAHALPGACPTPERGMLALRPVGDRDAGEALLVPLDGRDDGLAVPPGTRGFEAVLGDGEYVGYAERTDAPNLPILLWPAGRACRLQPEDAAYPAPGGAQAIGYDAASRALLVAGGVESGKSQAAVAFDVGTGRLTLTVDPERDALMSELRAFATVTPFGSRLLVAGGEDPVNTGGDVVASSNTAELYDPATGRFSASPIQLRVARTRHAALALPNGNTLLVGGRGPFGDALGVLEAISPARAESSVAGFPTLRAPRLYPSVMLLDDGRLFIGGGTAADASPLSALEWLSWDGRRLLDLRIPSELPARHDRAFAAMPGGGVLVVGGCAPSDRDSGDACGVCRRGCPPSGDDRYDAWWIDPDGDLVALAGFDVEAPRPVLLGGADGRPWLATGASEGLYRFDPWQATFELSDVEVPCPPRAGLPATSLDAQAFVWVGECDPEGPALYGLRVGTQNRFSPGIDLVPDRPVRASPAHEPTAAYDADGLWFAADSDVRVYVAGRDYADFRLELDVLDGSATPRLVLTARDHVGPQIVELGGAGAVIHVERSGTTLRVGSQTREVPPGRLRVGFARGDGETRIGRITLERTGGR